MALTEEAPRPRGRPRSMRCHVAILRATVELLEVQLVAGFAFRPQFSQHGEAGGRGECADTLNRDIGELARLLRVLSGMYDQAARSAASL